MVHNGIEYGMMAAIAEGLSIIKHANAGNGTRESSTPRPRRCAIRRPTSTTSTSREVAEVWRRGSVVGSWLVDLTADALARSPELDDFTRPGLRLRRGPLDRARRDRRGRARAGDHARRSIERFESRGLGEFTDKVLSAMRSEFGGHAEKK